MEQSIRELSIHVAQNKAFPAQPERLTRRKRWIIVDADFYKDDHAVIWFVRRGHSGTPVDEIHRMEKVDGVWRSPGGSGGEPGADLDERPTLAEIAALNDRNPFSRCEFGFNNGGGVLAHVVDQLRDRFIARRRLRSCGSPMADRRSQSHLTGM